MGRSDRVGVPSDQTQMARGSPFRFPVAAPRPRPALCLPKRSYVKSFLKWFRDAVTLVARADETPILRPEPTLDRRLALSLFAFRPLPRQLRQL